MNRRIIMKRKTSLIVVVANLSLVIASVNAVEDNNVQARTDMYKIEESAAADTPSISTINTEQSTRDNNNFGKVQGRVLNALEYRRMQEYVNRYVDSDDILKTLKTDNNNIIDCVDRFKQPGLKKQGINIQVMPTPPNLDLELMGYSESNLDMEAEQSYQYQAEVCPSGTIPIRRVTMDTLRNFESIDDFRQKVPNHLKGQSDTTDIKRNRSFSFYQYAHAFQRVENKGAESSLNVWSPHTQASAEFSLSQIWIARGDEDDLETVEAGWQVYRDKYGDRNARLFIYFTPDNYKDRGCYNLFCSAFVQTDNSILLGGKFEKYSVKGGNQRYITLRWQLGGSNNAWWLRLGNKWIGYYPNSLFDRKGIKNKAAKVDFGGEITDYKPGGKHTSTDMGSGSWPSEGFRYAAFQRHIRYLDSNLVPRTPLLTEIRTDRYCYDIEVKTGSSWGTYFFFGGPGYNYQCQ